MRPSLLALLIAVGFSCTPAQKPWRQAITASIPLTAAPDRALLVEIEASDPPQASAMLGGKKFSPPVDEVGDEHYRLVLPPGAELQMLSMGGYGCSACQAQCSVPSGTYGRVTRSTPTTF